MTSESFLTPILEWSDIEISDLQCPNGRTGQLLTYDALVRSLADNPSVLHNTNKVTTGYTYAVRFFFFSPSSL